MKWSPTGLVVLFGLLACSHDTSDTSAFTYGGDGAHDPGASTDTDAQDGDTGTEEAGTGMSSSVDTSPADSSGTTTSPMDGGGDGCIVDAECAHADPCTQGTCDVGSGTCTFQAVVACNSGDGCCPAGCSTQGDDDCSCFNFAPEAMSSASNTSPNPEYGPEKWTDGVNETECVAEMCSECYGWVSTEHPLGDWVQLEWEQPRTIGSMFIETSAAVGGPCTSWRVGPRNIERGDIEYWDGQQWVTAHTFDGEQGNLAFDFNPPLQTVALRIHGIEPSAGQGTIIGDRSSLIFEWYAYEPVACRPSLPPP